MSTPQRQARTVGDRLLDLEGVSKSFGSVHANAGITLHVRVLYGKNSHHKVEAIFKALGHALRIAVEKDPRVDGIPSTKGSL